MKAKAEIHESQAKDFIISTNESLNVKDNTQYVHNGYRSYYSSANLCDSGSPSSLETVPPFLKNEPTNKTVKHFLYVHGRNRPVMTEFECLLNPKPPLRVKDVIRKYCV